MLHVGEKKLLAVLKLLIACLRILIGVVLELSVFPHILEVKLGQKSFV